jgi:hypothetical protein
LVLVECFVVEGGWINTDWLAFLIKRIGAKVLSVWPLDAAQKRSYCAKIARVLQFLKDAFVEIRLDVELSGFAVCEDNDESVIGVSPYGLYSWVHCPVLLLERINTKDCFSLAGQFPVCHEFVLMDLDPGLDELHFVASQLSLEYLSVRDREYDFLALVLDVDVWQMVSAIVKVVH